MLFLFRKEEIRPVDPLLAQAQQLSPSTHNSCACRAVLHPPAQPVWHKAQRLNAIHLCFHFHRSVNKDLACEYQYNKRQQASPIRRATAGNHSKANPPKDRFLDPCSLCSGDRGERHKKSYTKIPEPPPRGYKPYGDGSGANMRSWPILAHFFGLGWLDTAVLDNRGPFSSRNCDCSPLGSKCEFHPI